MRKNIHKKSEARPIKNTPHKTTRNKKSPSQKPNPKFIVLWRRWILFNVHLYVHLRHSEQKIIPTTATTHITANFYHARLHTHFHKHNIWHVRHTKTTKQICLHSWAHQHIIFLLYYVQFLWAPTTTRILIYYVYFGAPALHIPIILCIVLWAPTAT